MDTLKIDEIRENPDNPRYITQDKFDKLVESLKTDPEMLEARPLVVEEGTNIVLGGNMRLAALRELGVKEVPVYYARWDEEKKKRFVIKDNVAYGRWDWDVLPNHWEATELEAMGLDVDPSWFRVEPDDETLPNAVNQKFNDYTLYFKNEDEMDLWYAFVTKLKTKFKDYDNVSQRVLAYVADVYEENNMKNESELILKFIKYDVDGQEE